jgi:hypothetical protein
MNYRRIMEFAIVGLWLTIAVVLFIRYQKDDKKTSIPNNSVLTDSNVKKRFAISRVIVLRGDTFDITIKDDGTRILGKLSVMATDNSKGKVLDLLNYSTHPEIILKEKQSDGRWTIDFFAVDNNGKEFNLVEWLSSNNLVYK